jgi:hypothetical protein
LFASYTAASSVSDDIGMHAALVQVATLPQIALRKTRGGRDNRLVRELKLRIARLRQGLRIDPQDDLLVGQENKSSAPANISAAIRFASSGHLGRASQALLREPMRPITDNVVNRLLALHPRSSGALPQLPPNAPMLAAIDPEQLRRIVFRKLANGAAPGPTGWTGELQSAVAGDDVCLGGICSIVKDIINGVPCPASRPYLLAASMTPAPKPGSDVDVRPIAVGESMYRLAGMYAITHQLPRRLFDKIQYGVNTPGGSEVAIHAIQAAINLAMATGQQVVVLAVDFRNAYNERCRSIMAAELYKRQDCAAIWRMFNWAYGSSSPLLLYGSDRRLIRDISSEEGVKQGDPIASIAYAVSVQQMYEDCMEGEPVTGYAVMDDFNLVGPMDACFRCLDKLARLARTQNFTLRYEKCRALWPDTTVVPPREFVQNCVSRQMQPNTGAMMVLGAMIGSDTAKISTWVNQSVQEHKPFFQSLLHEHMPKQIAFQILRACGIPRLNYLSRTISPAHTARGFADFDQMIVQTFQTLIELHRVTVPIVKQMLLPLRLGGLGLTSYLTIKEAAFLSSLCQSIQVNNRIRQQYYPRAPPLSELPWYQGLGALRLHLVQSGVPDSPALPASTADLIQKFANDVPTDLQSFITRHLHAFSFLSLRALSVQNSARFLSASHPAAKRWLSVSPSSKDLWLSNPQFVLAARNLLDVKSPNLPDTCRCGSSILPPFSSHFHSCHLMRRREVTARHDLLVQSVARLARSVGCTVTVEPRPITGQSIRPDLKIVGSTGSLMVDVSVAHPLASSFIRASSVERGRAAASRERVKQRKYAALAAREHCQILGFVLESYGAFGADAVKVLKFLANEGDYNGVIITPAQFLSYARNVISVTLQRGNAMVVAGGLRLNT